MDKAQLSITWRNYVIKVAELWRGAQSIYLSQVGYRSLRVIYNGLKKNFLRVQCKGQLVIRLIAIEYNERLLCYLSSYIHLLMSDLWLKLDLWSRLYNKTSDPDFSPRDDVLPSFSLLLTQCRVLLVIVIIICFWHRSNIGFQSY